MRRRVRFERLLPDPGPVELTAQLDELRLAERAPAHRPYVVANFAQTLDGRVAVDGRSGPIGDDGDREMFFGLRTRVDAVLVGTGTLRTERYGRLVPRPERRAERAALGLAADPLAVTITRSGAVPRDLPLLDDPDSTLVVYTGARTPPDLSGARARVHVVALDQPVPAAALAHLRAEHGARSVLCEGGPTLLGALAAGGVLDEVFLTVAPKLAGGGDAPGLTEGPPLGGLLALELAWVLERNGSLFLRHRLTTA